MMKEVLASKAQAEEKSVESAIHNATEQEPKVPASNQNVVSVSLKFRQHFSHLTCLKDQIFPTDDLMG